MFTRTTMTYAATAAVLIATGSLGLGMSARGSTDTTAAVPTWFAPIAASYGNNPQITPDFDFASLYSTGLPAWFAEIAEYYGNNPLITPDFDFAGLYGPQS